MGRHVEDLVPDCSLKEEKNAKDSLWHKSKKRDCGHPRTPSETERKRGDFGVHQAPFLPSTRNMC